MYSACAALIQAVVATVTLTVELTAGWVKFALVVVKALVPVAPVAPVVPVAPVAPVAPVEPVEPVGPVGPVAPVAPSAPWIPEALTEAPLVTVAAGAALPL